MTALLLAESGARGARLPQRQFRNDGFDVLS